MSTRSDEIEQKMLVEFKHDWYRSHDEEAQRGRERTITALIQELFPTPQQPSRFPERYSLALGAMTKRFSQQKNPLSFMDVLRSATDKSILYCVEYKIRPNDPYLVTVNSLKPDHENPEHFRLNITVKFDREIDTHDINTFNHDQETVTIEWILDKSLKITEVDPEPTPESDDPMPCKIL